MYKHFFKYVIDFLGALVGLILFSPIILIIILILLFVNNGKPFFLQPRPGKNGEIFKIIKFKTMADFKSDSNEGIHSLSRVTKPGAFIRKYSLDEIMQLVNVIKGDMSLIGPRPLLVEYLPLYNKTQAKRHSVRPGITGWAQIKGRNTISWNQKFEYDIWYVDNLNFMLDLKILFLTVKKVVKKEDINVDGDIVMPTWLGND